MRNAIIAAIVSAIVAAGAGSAATLSRIDRHQNTRLNRLEYNAEIDRAKLRCVTNYPPVQLADCLKAVGEAYANIEEGP